MAAGYAFGRHRLVCDVGGGSGTLLAEILGRHPRVHGILFDDQSALAQAPPVLTARRVADRCQQIHGSFFISVPEGADAYLLREILHNWDDARCLEILRAIRRAATPGATLLVLELLRDDPRLVPMVTTLDMQMMCAFPGGRQRTRDEFAELLARAGFRLVHVERLPAMISIIEAAAV